jgi:hypothetical protein
VALLAAALAGALACRDPTAGPGWLSGSRPPLPTYRAPRAAGAIEPDGRLDEPDWALAPQVELRDSLTGQPARAATRARLLWDERALHVAFTCDDDLVWARPGRAADDDLWEDEVVELFLDPSGRGSGYVEVEVSPQALTFDARFERPRADLASARRFTSGARAGVQVDGAVTVGDEAPRAARGWTAEVSVPWSALALAPRGGERWRMNLYRLETHGRTAPQGSAFSPPLRGDFHAVDRFGWLELAP